MPEDLDQIAAAAAEDEKIARVRVATEALLNLQRQAVHAAAHVGHPPPPATPEGYLLPAIPDTRAMLVAKLNHYANRSDDFKVSTTEDGLLQSAAVTVEDKTAHIIVSLAKIAIAAFKVVIGVPAIAPKALVEVPAEKQCLIYDEATNRLEYKMVEILARVKEAKRVQLEFDPANQRDLADVNQTLANWMQRSRFR